MKEIKYTILYCVCEITVRTVINYGSCGSGCATLLNIPPHTSKSNSPPWIVLAPPRHGGSCRQSPPHAHCWRGSAVQSPSHLPLSETRNFIVTLLFAGRVVDLHNFNADPDQAFHFHADPYLAPHQSDGHLRSLVYVYALQGSILSLQASIKSVHGPLRRCFRASKSAEFWL